MTVLSTTAGRLQTTYAVSFFKFQRVDVYCGIAGNVNVFMHISTGNKITVQRFREASNTGGCTNGTRSK
jgi:hypothetical protein